MTASTSSFVDNCLAKVPYRNRASALRRANRASPPWPVYQCRHCYNWHLTSKTKKQYRQMQRRIEQWK